MIGVLLVNMGGANSPGELKTFLARMFKDPFILPFGTLSRNLLSYIISNSRYRNSWKKYQLIGGSPIITATKQTVDILQLELGDNFIVKMAFSYSAPFIHESIASFIDNGINNITVVPLYPQSSYSTTSSVAMDVKNATAEYKQCNITFVKEFYLHEKFIAFWSALITAHISKLNIAQPYLVFSAHSIPEYLINKGDTYAKAIAKSAEIIAGKLNLPYEHAYQSGMKRGKWIGPDTKQRLAELSATAKENIVLIPISFINENLETMYDLDHDIIPFAKQKLGIQNISRVNIPVADKIFIELLKDIIHNK
jgi:protoporphyrin/coproporphyrin ferrochelatase